MKKETKKKVFNFALATTIVASVATPLAIVLGKESNLLFNKNLRQTTNDGQFVGSSYINENDYTLDLNSALGNQNNSNNRTISIGTSNIVKSIPQGYIVVSGDSNNKNQELICLDKNDPTKELWKLSLGNNNSNTNINIYGVEYTPYDGGRLIVLYSEDENDAIYKSNDSQVKFKVFKNFDSTPKLDFAGFGWKYRNEWQNDSGGRLDTWAINPIFNFSGEVTKYIIYCKEQYFTNNDNNGRTRFYLIDIKEPKNDDNKCYPIKVRWEGANYSAGKYAGNKKIILSIASFEENNNIYTLPLIVDFNDNKLELGFYRLSSNDGQEFNILNNKQHIKFDITIDSQIFNNEKNNSQLYEKAADLVKSSISSSTFQRTDSGLKIVFALNMNPNGTNNSPHRGGRFVILEISNDGQIKTLVKNLFHNSNDFLGQHAELWHGYFSNEVIAQLGINSTIDNKNLTPFIGVGWAENNLNKTYPWFVSTIKNPFDSNVDYSFNSSSNTDSNFRIYRVNGSNSGSQEGIYSGQGNNLKQYGDGLFRVGIPILEYNDQKNNNVFDRNILFTWNNQQKAIVINQKNRGGKINNVPTYGYYTRLLEANSSNGSDYEINKSKFTNLSSLVDMDTLKEETIKNQVFNLIKTKYLQNVVGNAQLVENSIKFNFPEGKIELKINVGNKWFNNEGKLVIEQNNTSKVFNISIIGFAQKQTNLINTNISLYGTNSGNYNNGFGKLAYTFIPTAVASFNENSTLDETKRFFTIVFKELVLNHFKKQQNNFRNLLKYSDNITTDEINKEFKNIFPKFKWVEANNEEGTIKVSLEIAKEYVYTNNTNYAIDIVLSGLRKIKKTELKNVEASSPLNLNLSSYNIPNDGNFLSQNKYSEVQLLDENILKQKLIEEINKEYSKANQNNGLNTEEGILTKHLPFTQKFVNQNGTLDVNSSYKLTKDHIKLSNFEFFAGHGVLKVDVKLLVWNEGGAHGQLKNTIIVDSQQPNSIESVAPSATWYVSGFRADNVETKFTDFVWELKKI